MTLIGNKTVHAFDQIGVPVRTNDTYDVVGFGALNVDLIYEAESSSIAEIVRNARAGSEITLPRDDMYRLIQQLERRGHLKHKAAGGQAANTVVALSRMGFRCGYIGCVGDDEEGTFLIDALECVDTAGIVRQGKSGICVVVLDETGERTIIVFPNANDTVCYDGLNVAYVSGARFLYLTSFVGDGPLETQKKLAEELGEPCRIALDPGEIYARRGLDQLRKIVERTEIVFATDSEIETLTGMNYSCGCQELLAMGASIVACKRGEQGSYIVSKDTAFEVPAETVDVVDTTGAGDVYAAGFIAGLLQGASLHQCASFATQLAAKSVTGYGRTRYPERSDLAQLQIAGN
jgi:ribokinase